jgi:hypothetical protein
MDYLFRCFPKDLKVGDKVKLTIGVDPEREYPEFGIARLEYSELTEVL